MKTTYWTKLKTVVYFASMIMLVTSTMACSKDKSSSDVNRRYRNNGYNDTYRDPYTGQQSNEWGAITRSGSFDQVLQDFMYGINDLGFVSGSPYDDTGIRFRGDARRGGKINILVWDDVASQTGEAYYWALNVVNVQQGSSRAVVTAEDGVGSVTFDGSIQNGVWSGTVYFNNSQDTNGASGTLGNFSIGADMAFGYNSMY
jgi:hypothetical protein